MPDVAMANRCVVHHSKKQHRQTARRESRHIIVASVSWLKLTFFWSWVFASVPYHQKHVETNSILDLEQVVNYPQYLLLRYTNTGKK
jgi:hypothetical protein